MHNSDLIYLMIVFLGAAALFVPLTIYLKLGSVTGYLIAGVIIGPYGFNIVHNVDDMASFTELGVVFLLFIIGLELQLSTFLKLKKWVLYLGGLQFLFTTLVICAALYIFNLNLISALILGGALAMSSTSFVLQMLNERGEFSTPHGQASFGVLLFQDLAVIPILIAFSIYNKQITENMGLSGILLNIAYSLSAVLIVFLISRYVLTSAFRRIAKLRLKEIFTAFALLVVVSVSYLMHRFDLSMSFGAFMAGILLAESEYRHEIESAIEPFKGLLLGLFFMSVGMMLNLELITHQPLTIFALVLALFALKLLVLLAVGKVLKLHKLVSQRVAFLLCQGGEFAFVVITASLSSGLLVAAVSEMAVAVVVLSMGLSPIIYSLASHRIHKKELADHVDPKYEMDIAEQPIIIAGFGRFGQIVGRIIRMRGHEFTALEHDPEHVQTVRRFGNKIYYGDASRLDLLEAAKADKAKLFVLAIDDVAASVRTAEVVRKHFPNLPILARARNREHVFLLRELGIESIVRETFYSGIVAAEKALGLLGEDPSQIEPITENFKKHDLQLLQDQFKNFRSEEHLIASSKKASEQLAEALASDTRIKSQLDA